MVQDKTGQYYLNKRIDVLEETIKDNHSELKGLISEHLKGCQDAMCKHNDRIEKVEHFKIRVYQSVSLVLGALGIYKVFF